MNPLNIVKILSLKSAFEKRHPKAVAFVNRELMTAVPEGTILELSLTRPGEQTVTANLKITAEDLEMLQELKNLSQSQSQ